MKPTISEAPSAQQNTRRGPLTLITLGLALVAVATTAVGLVVAGGAYVAAPEGLPDTGAIVGWGAPITRVLTDLAAVVTVGFLLAATFLDPSGKDGVVSRTGRSDLLRAAIAACAWAVLAIVQLFMQLAEVLGLTFSKALDPAIFSTYATEIPLTRALLVMAVLAIVVAIGCIVTSSTGASAMWLLLAVLAAALPALAGHGSGLGDHALALTSGLAHVIAAVLWVGGLAALALHTMRQDMPLDRAVSRFSVLALVAIVIVAASGLANGYTRLDIASQIFTTGYGQVMLAKVGLIIVLGIMGWLIRSRVLTARSASAGSPRERWAIFGRVAGLDLLVMAAAFGLGVTLASSAYPRIEVQLETLGESMLGFAYPPPPTIETVALGFRLEPLFFIGALIAGALYLAGVVRLRRRHDTWPVMRTVSWLAGLGVVIWCTNAGIASYAQVSVGLHMFQHMTLTMLAPILLVLGAPATLALRALKPAVGNERGPREWLVWFLHSWITRILTNPFYVFVVYVIGLYGLYFTPAFGWLMGSHIGHILMEVHFIASGYLFYWVIIGIDPRPRPLPYWGRLVLLLMALGVHGFFAVAMMMGTEPIAPEWYGIVRPDWVVDPLQDTLNGGQVAWGLSEIPTLIVLVAIAVQWSRSDDREAKRKDRQADRDDDAELRAYNEHLAEISRRDPST